MAGAPSRKPRDMTRLGKDLADLENSDPAVRAAAERLDEVVADIATGRTQWRDSLVRDLYADSGDFS